MAIAAVFEEGQERIELICESTLIRLGQWYVLRRASFDINEA